MGQRPSDELRLEREADALADRALSRPRWPHDLGSIGLHRGMQPPVFQRHAAAPGPAAGGPPALRDTFAQPGVPLEPALRRDMEARFGVDFSAVRVHTDAAAARSARGLSAHAFAAGQHLVFDQGRFEPQTSAGRRLLAHELAHVVQQASSPGMPGLQRAGFESTVQVCHRVLRSRDFRIDSGGLRVVLAAQAADRSVPNCHEFTFGVSLTRVVDNWFDEEIGTCEARSGGVRVFSFSGLARGTYHLTFWRTFDHPHCCLQGDLMVFDEAQSGDSEGCTRRKDLSTMDIVHGALDLAGFIPVLGAVPDGINAAIYVAEGDWANAGLSAIAAVPAWGDGIKLGTMAGKSMIKVEARTAIKLGEEGLAKEMKAIKAASKTEAGAAKHSAKEAADKATDDALDATFSGGKGEGAYPTTQKLARGNLGERLAADALAADGHKVLSYKPDIRGTNQGGIDMVTYKGGQVYFVDNKALTRSGNVSSVTALTTNFAKNKAAVLADLKAALKAAPSKAERDLLNSAITAIEGSAFRRVVTNANLTKDDAILKGVTQGLRDKGIDFIDVFKPLGKP